MHDKANLAGKLAMFDEHFSPKIIAYLNDYKVQVVKVQGEFVWHSHPDTDDFFLVLSGHLQIQLPDRTVDLAEGELIRSPTRSPALPESRAGGACPAHRACRNT